jgi:hypothetical protein
MIELGGSNFVSFKEQIDQKIVKLESATFFIQLKNILMVRLYFYVSYFLFYLNAYETFCKEFGLPCYVSNFSKIFLLLKSSFQELHLNDSFMLLNIIWKFEISSLQVNKL